MYIKIQNRNYELAVAKELKHGEQHLDGEISYSKRRITLDSSLDVEYAYEIVGHELIHASLSHTGLSNMLKANLIEAICDNLALLVVTVVDYKEFSEWYKNAKDSV